MITSTAGFEHPIVVGVWSGFDNYSLAVGSSSDSSSLPLIYLCGKCGHAFEARIYAENVSKGFLPATGILHHYRPVPVSSTVKSLVKFKNMWEIGCSSVETGVEQGDTVSMHYDPMIAKLVVWGENRAAALVKMKDCLSKFQVYLNLFAKFELEDILDGPFDMMLQVFCTLVELAIVVAGLPTNINFLQKLANHWAFENGKVETHFIEHFKDDLFVDPRKSSWRQKLTLNMVCISPFRVHHSARRTMELDWDNEYDSSSSKLLTFSITFQPDGNYLIETGEENSPDWEVKVAHLGNSDFRVEVDGVSRDVSLAVYSKDQTKHFHIWHGSHHHTFRQRVGLQLSADDEAQHKPSFEATSHPPGTVVAPMAGLVVKVLVKDGTNVEEGQPILVLEAMKMEHVVKAPSGGHVHGLQVTAGQQVSDGSFLFSVQVSHLQLNTHDMG
ncbi:Methylcrotonoyl-CoA carboxylase subunit alpha, mitochondrial [Vitis vinifera]|uniref:Methylcrotonoyl-CoA carboxylase subunit alpha, mitochondrial n=1 Tax=Vitis vinifera TaxID=29760 RepID=A0A438KHP3_VITVI|nr:Methylcrotonoyl-CoA carboxylase subunit alpha, mitochondrial [Vitis vinifera]